MHDHPVAKQETRKSATGAFQSIPIVPTSDEHLASALKRASRIGPNSKLKNEAAQAKNKTARQMDGEVSVKTVSFTCECALMICMGLNVGRALEMVALVQSL